MEKKPGKREMILEAALTLFAEKGFEAASVDEIGAAVNMKGPALYHYFRGKDAIFDALTEELEAHYRANFGSAENLGRLPETLQEFIGMSLGRLDFTLHDPRIRKVRRLLAAEQFRNEKIRRLATVHQVTAVEALNRAILTRLMEAGKVKRCDPALLAFEFTAPVTVMIALIDREPEREEEAMARIRAHMAHFIEVYRTEA